MEHTLSNTQFVDRSEEDDSDDDDQIIETEEELRKLKQNDINICEHNMCAF